MSKNVFQEYQSDAEFINGKSISRQEINTIYQSLIEQHEIVIDDLLDAIDCNDYVRLSHLLVSRNKIEIAIKEIEFLQEQEIEADISTSARISCALKDVADTMESKGEEVLEIITTNLEKLNHSAHNMISKTLSISNQTFSEGNRLNHKAGRLLINKTTKGLTKLADVIQKRS
ncbi:hypothetical protein GCM10011351_12690 [Paraliobacillus quinghaiensis]|uniref:Uncharacterized protein n=1 Tax=Paraliobacillus quinghaiensis TaxID=470815 RepID=A0A917TM18_9BACI|nr:hypothetical protein [Paraliobacillus quinghaiensis]GGM28246.1 hypothetical protein GCM10011351_12690 [Paraliobacillus quinghaiensis]